MSNKQYLNGERGMYTRRQSRGTMAGKDLYFGRVWIPRCKAFRYFSLGPDFKKARKKWWTILVDPEAALAMRAQQAQPAPAEPALRLPALINLFRAKYRGKKGSRGDSPYYVDVSATWLQYIGDVPVAGITGARIERFRVELEDDGYGASSVRKYLTSLATCFLWAQREGIVTNNPAHGVYRPEEPDREVDVLYLEEEQRLLAQLDPMDRPRVRLYIESGMRLGTGDGDEGVNLRWSQVDRGGGEIRISKSKNSKARVIPINGTLAEILDTLARVVPLRCQGRPEYVLSDREGRPLKERAFSRRVESALDRANIRKQPGALFNLFRHTFGSRLAEQSVPMAAITKLMGNTVAVCERHYLRFSPDFLRGAMATLDRSGHSAVADPSRSGDEKVAHVASTQVVD